MPYKLNTKSAQSGGPENIRPERTLWAHFAPGPVNSPYGITLENNEKSGRTRIGRTVSQGQVAERQAVAPLIQKQSQASVFIIQSKLNQFHIALNGAYL
ncbi:MAG: hypothetical protein AB8B71_08190 [Paracoccaceae bacterium]